MATRHARWQRRTTKREQAKVRQHVRDERTAQQQLAELDRRPGRSLKERVRLQAQVADGTR